MEKANDVVDIYSLNEEEPGTTGEGEEETMSPTLKIMTIMGIVLALIIFSYVYHLVTHYLAKFFNKRNIPPVFLAVIFKELSILGLISFILFIFQYFFPEDLKELVEDTHMTIFLTTIIYIILVSLLMLLEIRWTKRYRYLEAKVKGEAKPKLNIIPSGPRKVLKKILKTVRTYNVQDYEFIRENTLSLHGIRDDFDFSSYLKEMLVMTTLNLIEISEKIYLSIEVFLCVALSLSFFDNDNDQAKLLRSFVFTLLEWSLLVIIIVIMIKMRFIVRKAAVLNFNEEWPINDTSYDSKKYKDSCLVSFQKSYCSCFLKKSPTKSLFFLNSRGFLKGTIQTILLLQAFTLAANTISLLRDFKFDLIVLLVFNLIPAVVIIFFAVPFIVPSFVLVGYSGELADRKLLRTIYDKNDSQKYWNEYHLMIEDLDQEEEIEEPLLGSHRIKNKNQSLLGNHRRSRNDNDDRIHSLSLN